MKGGSLEIKNLDIHLYFIATKLHQETHDGGYRLEFGRDVGDLKTMLYQCGNRKLDVVLTLCFGMICNSLFLLSSYILLFMM